MTLNDLIYELQELVESYGNEVPTNVEEVAMEIRPVFDEENPGKGSLREYPVDYLHKVNVVVSADDAA